MFAAALCVTGKGEKGVTRTLEYYFATKRNELLIRATTWLNLGIQGTLNRPGLNGTVHLHADFFQLTGAVRWTHVLHTHVVQGSAGRGESVHAEGRQGTCGFLTVRAAGTPNSHVAHGSTELTLREKNQPESLYTDDSVHVTLR